MIMMKNSKYHFIHFLIEIYNYLLLFTTKLIYYINSFNGLYSTRNEEGNENYEQQESPKVIASVQFPMVNGTIVNGTHKIGQKQFSLVNCIPTSWVRFIKFH